MIHVEYEKKNNFPHDREIISFDRDAFQSLGDEGLLKVNKIYNVLCPPVFVIECLAPNRATEAEKKWLLDRLKLIENPLVFTGDTNISPVINIPHSVEYSGILSSEQIARNCIVSKPITMERVTPEKLISHYNPRIEVFKKEMKAYTEACEKQRGTLSPRQLDSDVQRYFQEVHKVTLPKEEIRNIRRKHERTFITQELDYASRGAQREIESRSVNEHIEAFRKFLFLTTDGDVRKLYAQIEDRRTLRIENYPDLAYPIYIYYLVVFMICARQHNTKHLDQSYVRDFRYLHYLNFCHLFITNEKSTPYIVDSIPYRNIKETHIMTSNELKGEL